MQLSKAHPWHGIDPNIDGQKLTAFIEIIPTDTVKYEIDKASGYLKIDRPQSYSNVFPALYGFIPQTYCASHVAQVCMDDTQLVGIKGDGDPLDICVLTEKSISHGDILVHAIPIGGFQMIDKNEADDKIIAVLKEDHIYGDMTTMEQVPKAIIERMLHYFKTYKLKPNGENTVTIASVYDTAHAWKVINNACLDYKENFSLSSKS